MSKVYEVEAFFKGNSDIPEFDDHYAYQAKAHQKQLTKPPGSLGKLEDIAVWLAGWQRKIKPSMDNVHCLIFAANHGVAAKGVSAYPSEVTAQMVENFQAGGAAINQLCSLADIKLSVFPIALGKPTRDFSQERAMEPEEVLSAMQLGFCSVPDNCDLLLLGEMGISNTTAAAAISCSLFKQPVEDWTGTGTGLNQKQLSRKISIIKAAHKLHGQKFLNTESILAAYGGREMAAIAGAVIRARLLRVPVLLDGFISTSAAATLTLFNKKMLEHCLVSHLSTEPGHRGILSYLDKDPILNLNLRLGEGSGAAIASLIIKSAIATHNGMSTFSEAGVSKKK